MGIPTIQRYGKHLTVDCTDGQAAIELAGMAFAAAVRQLIAENFRLPISYEEIRGDNVRLIFGTSVDSSTLLRHITTLTPEQFDQLHESATISDRAKQ